MASTGTPDPRATAIGVLVYVVLVLGVPFTAAVVASFGPPSSFEASAAPFFDAKPVLIVIVGTLTAIFARRAALVSAVAAGLVGELILVLLGLVFVESADWHFLGALYRASYSAAFCAVGAVGVWLFRRRRIAL